MVNSINGAGNTSSAFRVADASPRKAPEAAGVRPEAVSTRMSEVSGYALIQAVTTAFGYREPGLVSKTDLESPVALLGLPSAAQPVIDFDPKAAKQREALEARLNKEVWSQLVQQGYIDENGRIQDKFRTTSEQDFTLNFSEGEKSRMPQAKQEIYETLRRSDEGAIGSRIDSGYVMEKTEAGFGKLSYTSVILLLDSLKSLGYVSSSSPEATEKATRQKLIQGLAKFQADNAIDVEAGWEGNRVGPATINALVQALKTLE